MKLYVAGPMRGYDLFNFPMFFYVAIKLRQLGHEILNPAEYDMSIGLNPALPLDDPSQISFDMHDTLRKDFREVLEADGIVFLPGWEESTGALAEYVVAYYSGRKMFYWCTDNESALEMPIRKPQIELRAL